MQNKKSYRLKILPILRNALNYIESVQNKDGSFQSFSHSSDGNIKPSNTAFTTSLLLGALTPLKNCDLLDTFDTMRLETISHNAIGSILRQKDSDHCAWNYWNIGEPKRSTLPCDLDDTALAIAAILTWKPELITGDFLARLTHTLLATECTPGGPYITWLTDWKKDNRWEDCDIGVNANIAYMTKLLGFSLKNMDPFLQGANLESRYYREPLVLLYFISRGYTGTEHHIFEEQIHLELERKVASPMLLSLGCSALAYLNKSKEFRIQKKEGCGNNTPKHFKWLSSIIDNQGPDGSWKTEYAYFEYGDSQTEWFNGSPVLSTAFCIEALVNAYLMLEEKRESKKSLPERISEMYVQYIRSTSENSSYSNNFTGYAQLWSAAMFERDWIAQCILLPLTLREGFTSTQDNDTWNQLQTTHHLEELVIASLAGWIGYSLLDSIGDGENTPLKNGNSNTACTQSRETKSDILNFAQINIEIMQSIYQKILSLDMYHWASTVLRHANDAYSTERKMRIDPHMNFPLDNYNFKLSKYTKSIGAAIAPCVALHWLVQYAEIDMDTATLYKQKLFIFLNFYLDIRQGYDDAEDLIDDLARGHISPIGHAVLSALPKEVSSLQLVEQCNNPTLLLTTFWESIYDTFSLTCSNNVASARSILSTLPVSQNSQLHAMLVECDTLISRTNTSRKDICSFIEVF